MKEWRETSIDTLLYTFTTQSSEDLQIILDNHASMVSNGLKIKQIMLIKKILICAHVRKRDY